MGLGYPSQLRPPGRLPLRRRAAGALVALAALAGPVPALAQSETDSQTVEAQAAILNPGTMTKLADIDFGRILRPLAAGTVVLPPTASPACSITGGVTVRTGPCTSALFAIMGHRRQQVRITPLTNLTVVLTGSAGSTMTMTNLAMAYENLVPCSGSGVGNCNTGNGGGGNNPQNRHEITSQDGVAYFRVGGTLNVGADQLVGVYTGTFQVEVNFN